MIDEHSTKVRRAAQWLADQSDPPHPIVGALRKRFGLSVQDACAACSLAQRYRMAREAFG